MDFQSIQTKLTNTVNALSQSDAIVQVDWASEPSLPSTASRGAQASSGGPSRPSVDFSTAIDALQWRSEQAGGAGLTANPSAGAPPVEVYLKRLNAMAQKINQLSSEQERAIAEMQLIQTRLTRAHPIANAQGQPVAPPYLDADRAVLASAEMDHQGNIVLAYRTVSPNLSPAPRNPISAEVNQLASHLRTTYGPSKRRSRGQWSALASDLFALGQEPSEIIAHLSRTVWDAGLAIARFVAPQQAKPAVTHSPLGHPSRGASLSVVDGVLWLGGGVIGRLALNLLLAAFPALWSVAVAVITAITAYALYRATLAPNLAFGPAIRVFLLVLGLVVGGQL
ncbi:MULTISPECIES: hypothetical protein [Cyanophyceae]|uniref:hypothetical protein n=1 Tax=Cyanophyceae TaxID=3028117 RepID=UPI0016867905|nr:MULTISPECIES: hypothetical protein [Cyanophyceae]MBD1915915.1 hypothetical protein [Phormidium sp. FACHB-77]MBD2030411.1 hypothetical protein [Phormidium sp. FACHB-322]MBD2053413.1 hypothetical protein [Leptolyngbya sp. FACHB-60]